MKNIYIVTYLSFTLYINFFLTYLKLKILHNTLFNFLSNLETNCHLLKVTNLLYTWF